MTNLGEASRAPYRLVRRAFLASLGLVYLMAYASLWSQVEGLMGERGILPAQELLDWATGAFGARAWLRLPSLFWLGAGDAALLAVGAAGVALAALLVIGVAPRLVLVLLFAGYVSFVSVGDVFLGYQWDALLCETGFLAIFLAPRGFRPDWRRAPPPSPVLIWLLRWVLFRLMFLSGATKLLSGDATWRDFSALDWHYWTQPLPNAVSHYAHYLPAWFQRASVGVMFAIELGAPLLLFAPRKWRQGGAAAIALLMLLIMATGNYGFFEPLALALSLTWLDDRAFGAIVPNAGRPHARSATDSDPARGPVRRTALTLFAATVVAMTAGAGARRLGLLTELPTPMAWLERNVSGPLRLFNAYGLFAVMTTQRDEIVVEGTLDGEHWTPYEFRWKPGAPTHRPACAAAHMPRLDWQMWFAALGTVQRNPWYLRFVARLLEASPPVLALLARDPFEGRRPIAVRSLLYAYRFSDPEARRAGTWWTRERVGVYAPTLELVNGRLRRAE